MMKILIRYKIYLLVLLLILPAIFSLIHTGLPPTHDGEYHVIRFYEFDKVLRSGVLYPIWAPDLNYTFGSPLFLYVYPLPNYISSFFHFFGASFIDTFKLNLIFASIIGGIGMFIYGNYKFGKWGGLLSSVSYTYAPYHLLDIYVRGSVGEVWALAFFPLFLYFFDLGLKKQKIFYSFLAGIIFALIIFSHNILAVMFLGFIIFYGIFQLFLSKSIKKNMLYVFSPIFSGLLLASVFILPALLEQNYVVGLKVFSIFDHFPEIYQLIIPSWGSGYSGISNGTQMSFQIGLVNLLVILLIIFSLFKKKINSDMKKYVLFFFAVFFLSIFLVTPFSKFIYQNISVMQLFQFPWRFLSITILSLSVLVGSISVFYKSKILYVIIIFLIILSTISYAKVPYFHNRTDEFYTKNENFIYGTNSIGNAFQTKWLSQQSKVPSSQAFIASNNKRISSRFLSPSKQEYVVNVPKSDKLTLNTAYFPGWVARNNGKNVDIVSAKGVMQLNLQPGKNEIQLQFSDTLIRSVAKTVSLITFIIVLLILVKKFATIKS